MPFHSGTHWTGPWPPALPESVEESGFGYAVRFPHGKRRWHWWMFDPERPEARLPTKCGVHIGGGEIAVFEKLLEGPCCPECMATLRMLLITHGLSPHSGLDDKFKDFLRRTGRQYGAQRKPKARSKRKSRR